MKKFGSLLMSALLCASLLAGCSSSASVSQSTVPETISTAEGAIETGSEEVSLEEMTAAKTETSTEALEESSDDTVVRVGGLKGPTTMGLVKLMDDAKNGTAANNYEFTMVTAADELTGLVASGKVDIDYDTSRNIAGKNVLLVDDVIDTGLTLKAVGELFRNRNPKSLKVAAMLDKKERRLVKVLPDYAGFEIPDEFVVGFGLDYDEEYRNLPYIGIMKRSVYEK